MRLFCFPYSGAAASIYYPWSSILPETIEICPIQYPGHGTRVGESLIDSLPDMIPLIAQAIQTFVDKPFSIFGHSMGALLGFELARFLQQDRSPAPEYLFVSGHNAPQLPDVSEPIHKLPDQQFIDRLRKLNGTPEDVLQNEELRDLVLPIIRADFKLSETYQYQYYEPLSCSLCACGGLSDNYITRDGLDAWREQTTGKFSLRMFPGDHFYLNDSRMLLLQVIARELAQNNLA